MYSLLSFLIGLIFGLGLTISQMINPNKVQNFLDVAGHWDPSLLFVMVGAIAVSFIGYQLIKNKNPILREQFCLPTKTALDSRLIIGSALFGIGWGLSGYCPGPSISALGLGYMDPVYFVLAMVVGSGVSKLVFKQPKV